MAPLDFFQRPEDDVLRGLSRYCELRPFLTDSGFRKGLKALRRGSELDVKRAMFYDPRISQAIGAITGQPVAVTEEDVKYAESVGDIKKRDVVQLADLEAASMHTSVAEAKAAGNVHFKAERFSTAIACYNRALLLAEESRDACMERLTAFSKRIEHATPRRREEAIKGTGSDDDEDGEDARRRQVAATATAAATSERQREEREFRTISSVLHGNNAMALLRTNRPREALEACEEGLRAAPPDADVSKLHYRRAHAYECLSAPSTFGFPKDAVSRIDEAIASMKKAGEVAAANGSSRRHFELEVARLEKVRRAAAKEAEAKRAQAQREREAEEMSVVGQDIIDVSEGERGLAQQQAKATPSAQLSASVHHIHEQDFSHWSSGELSRRLKGLRHERAGTSIVIEELLLERSEVHASVKEKRGKGPSLFYDLDLMCTWIGHCAIGRASTDSPGCIRGEFRLYNVSQATKFEDGGDPATSYHYSLGLPVEFHNDAKCELWARQIKFEAAQLFFHCSTVVGGWVKDMVTKASASRGARHG
jgi:tetratricopeptide (TPR) repeat protein